MRGSSIVPDFLAIGHITRDLEAGGARLGGAVSYAALTAARLGMRAGILTSAAPDDMPDYMDVAKDLPQVHVVNLPSPKTTTFENIYDDKGRRQRIHALADAISPSRLPHEWRDCPVVLLAPVAGEVDDSFVSLFADSLLGVSPQGWMRHWDGEGRVSRRPWTGEGVIDKADLVALSEADCISGRLPDGWAGDGTIAVLTRGDAGAEMTFRGDSFRVPPYPAREVDPTGAGDVFVAAYLVSYYRTRDPFTSALFGSCAASLSVEAPGLGGVPTMEQVREKMSRFPHHKISPL